MFGENEVPQDLDTPIDPKCPDGGYIEGEECVMFGENEVPQDLDTPIDPVCPEGWEPEEREGNQLICKANPKCSRTDAETIGDYAKISKAKLFGNPCHCSYQVVCVTGDLVKKEGKWY